MAGQGIERREVLRVLALASAASGFPGFSRWAFACDHADGEPPQPRPAAYAPHFFSPAEYETVERLVDLIIPSDGTPGAKDAGVAEFVDFMVWSDPSVQYDFRYGLTWLDSRSDVLFGKPFRAAAPSQQVDLLEHLSYKAKFREGEDDGRDFFNSIRDYTMMGFYTTKIGLEQIDCPALKFYSESPGCPHHDDPEHRNLS